MIFVFDFHFDLPELQLGLLGGHRHSKLPSVLRHWALPWQLCFTSSHSLTSATIKHTKTTKNNNTRTVTYSRTELNKNKTNELPRQRAPRSVSECGERKPGRQVHAYHPGILRHSELLWHSCCLVAHSSTSNWHWAPWNPRRHEHFPGAMQWPPFSHARSQIAILIQN